jgi:hypothetical protein
VVSVPHELGFDRAGAPLHAALLTTQMKHIGHSGISSIPLVFHRICGFAVDCQVENVGGYAAWGAKYAEVSQPWTEPQ